MKMLVVFEKTLRLRHIGHLDLMRAMQRALRRSNLPIRYSQGFNPHILLSFAAPLSVGMWGKRELMEVPLDADIKPEDFQAALSAALPEDLKVLSVRLAEDTHAAPMALLRAARFEMNFDEDAGALEAALPAFLNQEKILAIRKTKTGEKECDLRPMIYEAAFAGQKLYVTLALCEEATCKPDLFLTALCDFAKTDRPHCLICRTQLLGEKNKIFIPLEDA